MTCAKKHVSTSSSQQSCGLLCSYDIQISMSNPVSRTVNRFRPAAPSSVLCHVSETAYIVYQFHVLVSSALFHLLSVPAALFRLFPFDSSYCFPTFPMTRDFRLSLAGSRFQIPVEPVVRFVQSRFPRRSVIIPPVFGPVKLISEEISHSFA